MRSASALPATTKTIRTETAVDAGASGGLRAPVRAGLSGVPDPDPAARRALLAGLGAYGLWGLVPLYFKLLAFAGAAEIIAHRVIWSVGFLLLVLLIRHRGGFRRHVTISPRVALALVTSGALVAVNWLVFVYAVNTDRVLSTSLGYFINPLVSVVLGTVVLRERMYGAQFIAVALAAAGTGWLTLALGQPPWLALALAFSFGLYGLVRKMTDVGPMVGLFWETLMLPPTPAARCC